MSLLARYADHLYWQARYLERAASLARTIEIHLAYDRGRDEDVSWAWLVALNSDQERFRELYPDTSIRNVIKFYVADIANPGSVRFALRAARENARALRALISTEMWIQINEFYNRIMVMSDIDLDPVRLSRTCGQIKTGCYAQLGIAESTLYRDEGWRFFRIGLMIERADQTSRLLDVKFAQLATGTAAPNTVDETFWSLVLRSAAAYQAFHRFEQRGADPNRVAKFLLVNASHPRSVAYCINEIQAMLHELRSVFDLRRAGQAQEQCDAILSELSMARYDRDLVSRLHTLNDALQRRLIDLGNGIGTAFFGHPAPSAQSQSQTQA